LDYLLVLLLHRLQWNS